MLKQTKKLPWIHRLKRTTIEKFKIKERPASPAIMSGIVIYYCFPWKLTDVATMTTKRSDIVRQTAWFLEKRNYQRNYDKWMPHLSALRGNLLVLSGSNFGDIVPFDIRVRKKTRNSQSLSCQSFDNNCMITAFLFVFGQRYPYVNAINTSDFRWHLKFVFISWGQQISNSQ
jgi:hypothetical protein